MPVSNRNPAPDVDFASLLVGVSSNLKLTALDQANRQQMRLHQEAQRCQAATLNEVSKQTAILGEQLDTQRKLLASQQLQTTLALLAEARRVEQLELRNAVFRVKQEIERIRKLTDPVACYFHLSLLGKDTDNYQLWPSAFEDLRDKEFAAEVLTLLSASREEMAGRLRPEDWAVFKTLLESRTRQTGSRLELEDAERKVQKLTTQLWTMPDVDWSPRSAQMLSRLRTARVPAIVGLVICLILAAVSTKGATQPAQMVNVFTILLLVFSLATLLILIWVDRLSRMRRLHDTRPTLKDHLEEAESQADQIRSQLHHDEEAIRKFVGLHPELAGCDFM